MNLAGVGETLSNSIKTNYKKNLNKKGQEISINCIAKSNDLSD